MTHAKKQNKTWDKIQLSADSPTLEQDQNTDKTRVILTRTVLTSWWTGTTGTFCRQPQWAGNR